ncbi:MAG: hypothetical protein H6655_17320 [Ardenticatenaceae bacterium]|nr:hypothetical protein [Ardenticatenaceae bacterium]
MESQERPGLVKLGYAGPRENEEDVVFTRIGQYNEGLSDNSIVHEAIGAKIFEAYLHQFVRLSQKEIKISFFKNPRTRQPTEWFELSPEVCKIITEVFAQDPPMKVHEVETKNLPIFLSGVLSAAKWHATNTSPEMLSQELANATLNGNLQFNNLVTQQKKAIENSFSEIQPADNHEANGKNDLENHLADYVSQATQNSYLLSQTKNQLQELSQLEAARVAIASLAAFLVFLHLAIFKSPAQGAWLAIIALLIMIFWSFIQPTLAKWLITYKHRAAKSRQNTSMIEK